MRSARARSNVGPIDAQASVLATVEADVNHEVVVLLKATGIRPYKVTFGSVGEVCCQCGQVVRLGLRVLRRGPVVGRDGELRRNVCHSV